MTASDFAFSLNNLSVHLAKAGHTNAALSTAQQAVNVFQRIAQDNPQRFESELACSLWALALTLRNSGDTASALAKLEDSIPLIEPYAERFPDSVHGRWYRGMLKLRRELTEGTDA